MWRRADDDLQPVAQAPQLRERRRARKSAPRTRASVFPGRPQRRLPQARLPARNAPPHASSSSAASDPPHGRHLGATRPASAAARTSGSLLAQWLNRQSTAALDGVGSHPGSAHDIVSTRAGTYTLRQRSLAWSYARGVCVRVIACKTQPQTKRRVEQREPAAAIARGECSVGREC